MITVLACVGALCATAQTPVIRVTTHLVQVSVVVHDKAGQPVGDLKQEDFVLYDNGHEQKIRYFAMETNKSSAPAPALLPPGYVSNRYVSNRTPGADPEHRTLPNSLTAILLDGLNTPFTDQYNARAALIKFLEQIQPGDQVAIYTLTNRLRVLHNFTSDTASLLRVLAHLKGNDSALLDSSIYADANTQNPEINEFLDQASARIAEASAAASGLITMRALESIALQMEGLPGRKNLIWLSAGFPVFTGYALNRSGMAIYPVDVRGLLGLFDAMPSMGAASGGPARGRVMGRTPADARASSGISRTQAAMLELAERTGGRAFMNGNDITGAIRQAMDDTRVNYVLSYAPTHNEWDGRLCTVKIVLKRKNVEARYRKGYFALPENSDDSALREVSLATAAASPLQATGIGVRAIARQTHSHVQVNIEVDGHDVSFLRDDKGQWNGQLDLMLTVCDEQGMVLNEVGRTARLAFSQKQYENAQTAGFAMSAEIGAPVKAIRARLVVRDVRSGAMGSVDLPLRE